ncbi:MULTISPECIES: uracil-DNA glycosylase [unclassified Janthinobacterium]|uniref:uracil-DNA glycosylase n=1 Tax=unclassified Janthinobacterium TaxID=2610881 RepID=UPI000348DBE4|nr:MULTISPECIES: uracil-DNA glycosylase [unclassified Janthinobacterium]MEC5162139.1 uracil-DNA glycosylase family 4 [Janthinobacterium sp. CG_S6]
MNQSTGRSAVFLEEMGVGALWRLRQPVAGLPDAELAAPAESESDAVDVAAPAVAAVAAAAAAVPAATPARPVAAAPPDGSTAWFDDAPAPPPPVPVSDQAIAAMDWNELKTAIAKCTRCQLGSSRKGVVFGRGDRNADWLVVGSGPNRADERDAQALSGAAGKLLDNMLLAIGLQADSNVYVTNLVKCRPGAADGAERAPTAEENAACRPFLERELALTGGRIILTIGQAAAGGLIRSPAAARGTVRRLGGIPVVATYHPEDMLRQSDTKAKAWGDLCLAKRTHAAAD